jgi:tetratricopeptide (TPR) repeat protein
MQSTSLQGVQYVPPTSEWPANTGDSKRNNMNTAAINRLLTILSSKVEIDRTRLYQLIELAERCYCLKDMQGQRELGLILQEFPHPFNLIGNYYEAIYLNHIGLSDEARKTLERVYEHGPEKYRAKALISLGAVEEKRGNFDESMRFRLQAASFNIPSISLQAQHGMAVLLGIQGEHKHAVKHLESFLPLARMLKKDTPLYYDYLNSFAVELDDSGRTEEARNVISLVLSTPYVKHYLNWIDTGKEIYKKSYRSSTMSMPKVRFEKAEEIPEPIQEIQPANVIAFPPLKEAPEPEMPEPLTPQESRDLPLSEKRELILAAIRASEFSEFEYDKLMVSVGLLKAGPAEDILDLEDEQLLDDIIVIWSDHIGAETLAGVLSALRDCDDSLRRNDIIDRMIRKAFQSSHLSGLTEEAWRLRVERRLPKK